MKAMKIGTAEGFFEQVVEGLEASVQYSKRTLSLSTTILPEPLPEVTQAEVFNHGDETGEGV
jgi:hypothetical protein